MTVYRLSEGIPITLRGGTTDGKVFDEIFLEQTYAPGAALVPRDEKPLVLIDLGANVGLSTLFFARLLHPVRIVAVEPCPNSFQVLLENTRSLADRCTVVQAFAGAQRGHAQIVDAGFGAWGLRMGASERYGIPVQPISELVPEDADSRVVLKCDIEGSECHLFRTLHLWEHLVDLIILELHTEFFSAAELEACLADSSYEWVRHGVIEPGALLAVIVLERAGYNQSSHDSRNSSRGAAAM